MSNDRETRAGGGPVPEAESTPTQVQAAVHRAVAPVEAVMVQPPAGADSESISDAVSETAATEPATETAPSSELTGEVDASQRGSSVTDSARVAPIVDIPSAGENQTPEQIFAAAAASSGAARANQPAMSVSQPPTETQTLAGAPVGLGDPQTPAVGASEIDADPVRDGEIRISADHPMATLYMQSPMPPDLRGNRAAGFWIALLSTFTFALLLSGSVALVIAPVYPPSIYLSNGLIPSLLSPTFFLPVIAFLITSIVVVLIVGRAGWWAHIIGSFVVALATGGAALLAILIDIASGVNALLTDFSVQEVTPGILVTTFGVMILAREISMWFGCWIGARGRKMTRLNNEALDAYEVALAEVKAPRSSSSALS